MASSSSQNPFKNHLGHANRRNSKRFSDRTATGAGKRAYSVATEVMVVQHRSPLRRRSSAQNHLLTYFGTVRRLTRPPRAVCLCDVIDRLMSAPVIVSVILIILFHRRRWWSVRRIAPTGRVRAGGPVDRSVGRSDAGTKMTIMNQMSAHRSVTV